jgi:hypothetical protein
MGGCASAAPTSPEIVEPPRQVEVVEEVDLHRDGPLIACLELITENITPLPESHPLRSATPQPTISKGADILEGLMIVLEGRRGNRGITLACLNALTRLTSTRGEGPHKMNRLRLGTLGAVESTVRCLERYPELGGPGYGLGCNPLAPTHVLRV